MCAFQRCINYNHWSSTRYTVSRRIEGTIVFWKIWKLMFPIWPKDKVWSVVWLYHHNMLRGFNIESCCPCCKLRSVEKMILFIIVVDIFFIIAKMKIFVPFVLRTSISWPYPLHHHDVMLNEPRQRLDRDVEATSVAWFDFCGYFKHDSHFGPTGNKLNCSQKESSH